MREFNTSGPCNPALHYTVMRETLIVKGKEKVRKGRYFTLFAPRQTGKTTYFQLLLEAVRSENFTPIWVSFEKLKTVTRDIFYQDLNHQLHKRLHEHQIQLKQTITNQVEFVKLFEEIKSHAQSVILVIDEFEGIPDAVLSEMMHAFRQMYHQKSDHALHSLILVGVSTIAELVMSVASPFNIAEELKISFLRRQKSIY